MSEENTQAKSKKNWRDLAIPQAEIERIFGKLQADGVLSETTPRSIQEIRQSMIASGIRPEDNSASCGIIAAREEY